VLPLRRRAPELGGGRQPHEGACQVVPDLPARDHTARGAGPGSRDGLPCGTG